MCGIRGFIFVSALALSSTAGAQSLALGLTRAQLEDADLVDANGVDIGDVEYAIVDSGGRVVALAIEVDSRGPQPDKLVSLALQDLRAVLEPGDPGDYNIVTAMSAAQVMSLPTVLARR
jgi:hypothetical protein